MQSRLTQMKDRPKSAIKELEKSKNSKLQSEHPAVLAESENGTCGLEHQQAIDCLSPTSKAYRSSQISTHFDGLDTRFYSTMQPKSRLSKLGRIGNVLRRFKSKIEKSKLLIVSKKISHFETKKLAKNQKADTGSKFWKNQTTFIKLKTTKASRPQNLLGNIHTTKSRFSPVTRTANLAKFKAQSIAKNNQKNKRSPKWNTRSTRKYLSGNDIFKDSFDNIYMRKTMANTAPKSRKNKLVKMVGPNKSKLVLSKVVTLGKSQLETNNSFPQTSKNSDKNPQTGLKRGLCVKASSSTQHISIRRNETVSTTNDFGKLITDNTLLKKSANSTQTPAKYKEDPIGPDWRVKTLERYKKDLDSARSRTKKQDANT